MPLYAAASGKRWAQTKVFGCSLQCCLKLNLFGLVVITSMVQSGLQLCGLTWQVPDFSTLCRRKFDLNVQVPYTCSQVELHLSEDSTTIKVCEWQMQKVWPLAPSPMAKAAHFHDARTLQIQAICVTFNSVSDARRPATAVTVL